MAVPSDWLTYREEKTGYQMRYPKNLRPVYREVTGITIFTDVSLKSTAQFLVNSTQVDYGGDIEQNIQLYDKTMRDHGDIPKDIKPDSIFLNGLKGMKYDSPDRTRMFLELFGADSSGVVKHYSLWITKYGDERDEINKMMLSTFTVEKK